MQDANTVIKGHFADMSKSEPGKSDRRGGQGDEERARRSGSPGSVPELPEAAKGILAPFWTSVCVCIRVCGMSTHTCLCVSMGECDSVGAYTHIYASLCLRACVTMSLH